MSTPPVPKKTRRLGDLLLITAIVGALLAGAYYQESLLTFFRLRMWDHGAPARAVSGFLTALKARDRGRADQFVGSSQVEPLTRKGKWAGYHISGLNFKTDMEFADLVPAGEPKPTPTEFSPLEGGSAQLRVPNSKGEPVLYTLKMVSGTWKVVNIRVGA